MFCIGKKRYIIKSPLRFILFVTIVCMLAMAVISAAFGFSNAKGMAEQEYIQIEVKPGDTLWSLASDYMPNMEIRKSIHIISEINDTSASELCAGQMLKIPTEP